MSSPKQIKANQLNAKNSTGPKTEEGKATVSKKMPLSIDYWPRKQFSRGKLVQTLMSYKNVSSLPFSQTESLKKY